MSYQALLFYSDEKTARVLMQVLDELDFSVEPDSEPFAAVKTLMLQRFAYARVNMFTKFGHRRFRRNPQHQRHNPGNHPGNRLQHRIYSPADREVEHYFMTFRRPPSRQKGARRCDHR